MNSSRVVWLTGLPGSGKTTLAWALQQEMNSRNENAVVVDGDVIREILSETEKYDNETRKELANKYQKISLMLIEQGFSVIVSTVSLFHDVHTMNRNIFPNYFEVFLDVDLDYLQLKERKKMYSLSKDVPGLSLNAEYPESPHLILRIDEYEGRNFWLQNLVEKLYE
jgi:adenylylsulfate kinase-like enzyme